MGSTGNNLAQPIDLFCERFQLCMANLMVTERGLILFASPTHNSNLRCLNGVLTSDLLFELVYVQVFRYVVLELAQHSSIEADSPGTFAHLALRANSNVYKYNTMLV